MQELAQLVDRVTQADRRFFERFPHRQHRIRLSGQAELMQNTLLDGKPWAAEPGFKFFTLVKNLTPGTRMRLYIHAPEGWETDVDEAVARSVYEIQATPQTRKIEAQMRKALEARG
jgi:hypothetical protein